MTLLRRAVFLDRDGVLNRTVVRDGAPRPPASPDELEILPGVPEALAALAARGWVLVVVTNQPDVARGRQARAVVEAINRRLLSTLPLRAVLACYHDDADRCDCRKPRPGLLRQAAAEHGLDLDASVMVGDRWSDVQAGAAAGCRTFLVRADYSEPERCRPDHEVADLGEAAAAILRLGGRVEEEAAMPTIEGLRVKLFADGADIATMVEMARRPYIAGFTTNPTLMRKAGVADYRAFAREALRAIPDRPISFEVFADDLAEMERQAHDIAGWGDNVYVKIPVTDTEGRPTDDCIRRLAKAEVQLNVTAVLTLEQVQRVSRALEDSRSSVVSVFAGRIADTGRDPVPIMTAALDLLRPCPGQQLLWASPRELLNVFQADAIGCHIITATADILQKLALVGKDLTDYSLETVRMFHRDAQQARYVL
jgi:transaldolase